MYCIASNATVQISGMNIARIKTKIIGKVLKDERVTTNANILKQRMYNIFAAGSVPQWLKLGHKRIQVMVS